MLTARPTLSATATPEVAAALPAAPRRGVDAVAFLTFWLALLVVIPAKLSFAALGGAGSPATLTALLAAGWWAWYHVNRSAPTGAGHQPVRIAHLAFVCCVLVSYVGAMTRPINSAETSTADLGLLGLVGWTGIILLANDGITDRARFDVLVRRLVLAGGFLATIGIIQFVTGDPLVDRISIPGLTANQSLTGVLSRSGFTRPAGTAVHPIEFGTVLVMLLPFALTTALTDQRRSALRRWYPVAAISLAVFFSISRSALIGAVVVLAILVPVWPRGVRIRVLSAVVGLCTVVFLTVPGMIGTLTGLFTTISDDSSARSRTESYALVWEFVARAPVIGRGFSTFLPGYRILDNQYLVLLIEVGAVGLAAMLALLVTGIVVSQQTRRAARDEATAQLGQALTASIAAGALSLALFDGLGFPMSAGMLFFVLGLAGALRRIERTPVRVVEPEADTSVHP
ncbi:O-antigen ligase family protein [Cellulomonas hominis]